LKSFLIVSLKVKNTAFGRPDLSVMSLFLTQIDVGRRWTQPPLALAGGG